MTTLSLDSVWSTRLIASMLVPPSLSTGIVPTAVSHHAATPGFQRVFRAKKLTCLGRNRPTMGGSRWLTWFAATMYPPVSGRFSSPATSPRKNIW